MVIPYRWPGGLEKPFEILARLDDSAQMMVVREAHARRGQVIGNLRQFLTEARPAGAIKPRGSGQRAVPISVYRIAGLGNDEHRATQSLQKAKVRLQGPDLFAG